MARDETVKAIEAALERDSEINLHRSPIRVERDHGLRLRGTVADVAVKRRAVARAQEQAAGEAVVDELWVETGEHRGEDALRQAVAEMLKQEPAFVESSIAEGNAPPEATTAPDRIAVATSGSRVYLRGRVVSLARRRLAQVLTWWVPGVSDVINELEVEAAEADSDGELADAVRVALEKDPSIPAGQIDITARNGVIRLAGAVSNEEQRRLATLDCWYVPGVARVEDGLAVKTP